MYIHTHTHTHTHMNWTKANVDLLPRMAQGTEKDWHPHCYTRVYVCINKRVISLPGLVGHWGPVLRPPLQPTASREASFPAFIDISFLFPLHHTNIWRMLTSVRALPNGRGSRNSNDGGWNTNRTSVPSTPTVGRYERRQLA